MANPPLPPILWHYTDANGLFGIVKSSQLRFGDSRFMNDRTERVYGSDLLERVFDEECTADNGGATAKFRGLVRTLRSPDRLYVCSFSETRESLSQWQRYGADGSGYCIGFDLKQLDLLLDDIGISRESMLYNEKDQLELLRESVRKGLEKYRRLEESGRQVKHSYIDYLFTDMDINAALLRMKNPFFHDEQEWRYLSWASEDGVPEEVDEQFSVRGSYIKPFVQLPPAAKAATHRLPIVSVVCGPRLDADLAVLSIRRFFKSAGYEVDVAGSDLAAIWR